MNLENDEFNDSWFANPLSWFHIFLQTQKTQKIRQTTAKRFKRWLRSCTSEVQNSKKIESSETAWFVGNQPNLHPIKKIYLKKTQKKNEKKHKKNKTKGKRQNNQK